MAGADEPADQTEPIDATVVGPPPVLNQDISCRKCGYNLRGLNSDARCPECGARVALSASDAEELLCHADPAWLRSVTRGVALMTGGVMLLLLYDLGLQAIIPFGLFGAWVGWVLDPAILGGAALVLAGAWRLAAEEPNELGVDRHAVVHRVITTAVCIGIAWLAMHALSLLGLFRGTTRGTIWYLSRLAEFLMLGGVAALLYCLATLARRVPDLKTARLARILMIAIPAGMAPGIIQEVLVPRRLWSRAGATWAYAFWASTTVIAFVLLVLSLSIGVDLWRAFKRQIAAAESAPAGTEPAAGDQSTAALPQ